MIPLMRLFVTVITCLFINAMHVPHPFISPECLIFFHFIASQAAKHLAARCLGNPQLSPALSVAATSAEGGRRRRGEVGLLPGVPLRTPRPGGRRGRQQEEEEEEAPFRGLERPHPLSTTAFEPRSRSRAGDGGNREEQQQ